MPQQEPNLSGDHSLKYISSACHCGMEYACVTITQLKFLVRDAEANEIVLCQSDAYIHIRPRNIGVGLKGVTIIKSKTIESRLNCTLHNPSTTRVC